MKEEWRDIEGYEGLYQVSNQGRVKSLDRVIERRNNANQSISERVRAINLGTTGYMHTSLYKGGKGKTIKVHKLVAKAFIPNPEDKLTINHINGIKTDNRVENLERCTYTENALHAYKTGLRNSNSIKKAYSLVQPNGIIWLLHGLNNFSKHMNLSKDIYKVTSGRAKQSKGWTATKLNLEGIA